MSKDVCSMELHRVPLNSFNQVRCKIVQRFIVTKRRLICYRFLNTTKVLRLFLVTILACKPVSLKFVIFNRSQIFADFSV